LWCLLECQELMQKYLRFRRKEGSKIFLIPQFFLEARSIGASKKNKGACLLSNINTRYRSKPSSHIERVPSWVFPGPQNSSRIRSYIVFFAGHTWGSARARSTGGPVPRTGFRPDARRIAKKISRLRPPARVSVCIRSVWRHSFLSVPFGYNTAQNLP